MAYAAGIYKTERQTKPPFAFVCTYIDEAGILHEGEAMGRQAYFRLRASLPWKVGQPFKDEPKADASADAAESAPAPKAKKKGRPKKPQAAPDETEG